MPEREDRPRHRRAHGGAQPPPGAADAAPRSATGSALKAGLLGFLGTLAVVAVIVLAVRAADSHSHSASPAANGTSGASGTGAAGGTASGPASSVRAWASNGGTAHLTALTRDVGAVDDDSSARDTVSMGQDCVTLQSDLRAAQVYPAVPERATQQHLSTALALLAQAAADCSDGTATGDPSLITRSGTELRSGSTELDLASARVNELAGL